MLRRIDGDPGPIRLPYLSDSRALNWRPVGPEHDMRILLRKVYIGALCLEPPGVWALVRVQWCENCGHWEVAQAQNEHAADHTGVPITHLSEDILGVPRLP